MAILKWFKNLGSRMKNFQRGFAIRQAGQHRQEIRNLLNKIEMLEDFCMEGIGLVKNHREVSLLETDWITRTELFIDGK